MTAETKYRVTYYDADDDWSDVSDEFNTSGAALKHARATVHDDLTARVERVTTEELYDVSRATRVVVKKL